MFVVVSSRVQTDWTCGRTGPALPPPPAPIGPAATASATVTSPAATFPWPSPTQQNLLQKPTSMQQCRPTQTISRLADTRFSHFFGAQGWEVAILEMLRAVSGVAGCWLYRGMTSLEPPTELCTGALTSAPPHLPHPANSPPNTQTTYFQTLQPPAIQPCCLLDPVYCTQPHSKADA